MFVVPPSGGILTEIANDFRLKPGLQAKSPFNQQPVSALRLICGQLFSAGRVHKWATAISGAW